MRELGRSAICDAPLYNRVLKTHCWDAFEAFCAEHSAERGGRQAEDPSAEFDSHRYVRQMIARRKMLNAFIRVKPHVVVADERFFTITFLSEIDVAVHELTAIEVAEAVNEFMRPRGLYATVRAWFDARRH